MMVERKSCRAPAKRHAPLSVKGWCPDEQLRHRLQQGLDCLGLPLAENQRDLLTEYLALLIRWNAVYNLTAVRDPLDMLALHVLDSLSIVDLVRDAEGLTVLDVGTGAGLPGIPLAIALPDRAVRLIDAVAKKVSFLQQVKSVLKLSNIQPQHGRIEALTLSESPAVIISRAYSDLAKMVRSINHLVDDSTIVIAMKGVEPKNELAALPAPWRVAEIRVLDVPFIGAQRCAVVLTRPS